MKLGSGVLIFAESCTPRHSVEAKIYPVAALENAGHLLGIAANRKGRAADPFGMSFAGQRESFAKSVTHSDSSSMPRAGPAGREDQSDHSRSCLQADPLAILSIGRTASARKLRYRRKVLVHARGDKPRAPDADRTGTGSRLLPQRSSRSPAQVR